MTRHIKAIARQGRPVLALLLGWIIVTSAPAPATAQGLFSPAIRVNESIITNYELEQRARFLQLLQAPGNPLVEARSALIDDRLKQQVLTQFGLAPTPEAIEEGMTNFAQRAELSREEFIQALGENGVSEETFRDFVTIGVGWSDFVRARFSARARPSDNDIDRALGSGAGASGLRVLLSEIIIPAPADQREAVLAEAERLSGIRSTSAFSDAARQVSAAATRDEGGRMDWMPIGNLPPQIRPLILDLAPGEVTAPIPLQEAVAVFQLRAIQETRSTAPRYAAVEYAIYRIAGGRSEAALAEAADIAGRIDTCDDLYGVALDQPAEVLDRTSLPPREIPRDIAVELAKLDPGEHSTALTRGDGSQLLFLMLCGRTNALNEDASREEVANALLQSRLAAFADTFLEQLRADALIVDQ